MAKSVGRWWSWVQLVCQDHDTQVVAQRAGMCPQQVHAWKLGLVPQVDDVLDFVEATGADLTLSLLAAEVEMGHPSAAEDIQAG